MIRVFALAFACAAIFPFPAQAQYSANASKSAQQGVFIYRPATPGGNLQVQPRAGLSAKSPQGAFIYRQNATPSGNFAPAPRAGLSNRAQQGLFVYRRNNQQGSSNSPQQEQQLADNDQPTLQQGTGTIDRVTPTALFVRADGANWAIKPDADAEIEVVGGASRSFLKAGQYVKFTSRLDKDTGTFRPLDELAVVSLRPGDRAGVTELVDADENDADKLQSVVVLGRINNVLGNQLSIATGKDTYRVDVNSDAKVNLRTADFSMAQPGDKITVTGYKVSPGVAQAKEIKITLSKPARAKKVASSP